MEAEVQSETANGSAKANAANSRILKGQMSGYAKLALKRVTFALSNAIRFRVKHLHVVEVTFVALPPDHVDLVADHRQAEVGPIVCHPDDFLQKKGLTSSGQG